jgi:hypothetical protein
MKSTVALLAVICSCGCSDRITPREATQGAMMETFARIQLYAETNRSVPRSLSVLPRREGYANRTTDGWHRELFYRIGEDGMLSLTSCGADGKAGGSGEDADISVSYRSKKPDGTLWVGSDMWLVEAQAYLQPQGGANGKQPLDPKASSTSAAAASRRSP